MSKIESFILANHNINGLSIFLLFQTDLLKLSKQSTAKSKSIQPKNILKPLSRLILGTQTAGHRH